MNLNTSKKQRKDIITKNIFFNKNFQKLWTVGAITMANQWLEMLAISIFVYSATQSALAVTFANFARALPMVFFGFFAGIIADRFSRKKLLIFSFTVLLSSNLVLSLLAYLQLIEIWHILIGMFLTGTVFATDFPIRRNMLGEMAGSTLIGKVMGYDSVARNGTRIIGPLLGGALMEYSGLYGAYLLLALLYSINILQMYILKYEKNYTGNKSKESYYILIIEGLKFAKKNPPIFGFLFVTLIMNLFAFPYMTMVPVIGESTLKVSPLMIGIILSIEGFGAMSGSLFISLFKSPKYYKKFYYFGSCLFMLGILFIGISKTYEITLGIALIAGLGVAGFSTMQSTLPFIIAPPHMRSRILGLVSVCIGINPLGILLVGILATTFNPATAIMVTASCGLISLLILYIFIKEVH